MYTAYAVTSVLALTLLPGALLDPGAGAGADVRGYKVWAGTTHTAPGHGGSSSGGGGGAAGTGCTLVPGPYPSMEVCGGNGAPYGITLPTTPGTAAPTASPLQLALLAYKQLVIPEPTVLTAPPRGHDGLVGLPEFYWADRTQWRAQSRRVEADGVWAEVTAAPTQLTISPGDGRSVSCPGPGTPYDQNRSPDEQDTTCTHLYQRSSAGLSGAAYTVTGTVVWAATWVGSGGSGGTLPPTTRSTTFPIRVAEGQALVQRSS